jgi:hypothetical protein
MAERRFVKRGEYELFLDENIYDAFLNGGRHVVFVLWHGWHRLWQPSREAREQTHKGALFFDRSGSVMLDLLTPELVACRQLVKLQPQSECSNEFISFIVNV